MRIDIKLNSEYAAGFRNFVKMFKPDEIDDREFYRQLMFKGINKHIEDVQAFAQEKMAEAQAAQEGDAPLNLESTQETDEQAQD